MLYKGHTQIQFYLFNFKSFYFPKVTLIPTSISVEEDTGDLKTNFTQFQTQKQDTCANRKNCAWL